MNFYDPAFNWLVSLPVHGRDRYCGVHVVRLSACEFSVDGRRCGTIETAAARLCQEIVDDSLCLVRTRQ